MTHRRCSACTETPSNMRMFDNEERTSSSKKAPWHPALIYSIFNKWNSIMTALVCAQFDNMFMWGRPVLFTIHRGTLSTTPTPAPGRAFLSPQLINKSNHLYSPWSSLLYWYEFALQFEAARYWRAAFFAWFMAVVAKHRRRLSWLFSEACLVAESRTTDIAQSSWQWRVRHDGKHTVTLHVYMCTTA